jgi:protein HOOK3
VKRSVRLIPNISCSLFTVNSAPEYFDPTTIARHLGDNWVLKNSNLRRLVRNLQDYLRSINKDAPDAFEQLDLQSIAKDQNREQIVMLFELLAAAAVTSERKGEYVNRIMTMSQELQLEFKAIIQSSLKRLVDYVPDEDDEDDEDGSEMVFGHDAVEEDEDEDDGLDNGLNKKQLFPASSAAPSMQLEDDLQEAKQQVASLKSQLSMQQEDSERAQEKLRSMVEDLQDRLVQRQDELIQVEEDLQKAISELEDTKSKLLEAQEEATRLADDLDVASAKAQQLAKVEATLQIYKKKLEQVGGVTQQMRDAEDQSANYVKQIMELEAQVKKSAAASKQVEQLQEQLKRLEKEKETAESNKMSTANEIADLKNQLKSANSSKKSYEEELVELRAKLEVQEVQIPSPQAKGFDDALNKEQNGKLAQLEIENQQLREHMEQLKISSNTEVKTAAPSPQPSTPVASAVSIPFEDSAALNDKIKQLEEELAQKDAENKKIVSDKDKLEAYTKRTLAKFQDKYLVALQECKLKLKEKQDKIEALEQRGTAERMAQKREERLLSSTIYELGMAIMQDRLKESR